MLTSVSISVTLLALTGLLGTTTAAPLSHSIQVGERPLYLSDRLAPGPLRDKLQQCDLSNISPQPFSIAHRGAPLLYPEHSLASYLAAIRQGAGVVECDVTFSQDKQLVCRHSQCDLHHTTDILLRPELAARCDQPFQPYNPETGAAASAQCCTSTFTLDEIQSLCARMEGFDPEAKSAVEYINGGPDWRSQLHGHCERPMSHDESIALIDSYGLAMAPELKQPDVVMPYLGFSQADYANAMVEAYVGADIQPERVFLQSFNLADIQHWLTHWPDYAQQAVWLDGRSSQSGFDPQNPDTWQPSMQALADLGVRYIGPPLWMLVTHQDGVVVPSVYAEQARAAGLEIIAWTVERSGDLRDGGGWYYQTIAPITDDASMVLQLLDVLKHQVNVHAVFSDWPATTTYFSHCTAE